MTTAVVAFNGPAKGPPEPMMRVDPQKTLQAQDVGKDGGALHVVAATPRPAAARAGEARSSKRGERRGGGPRPARRGRAHIFSAVAAKTHMAQFYKSLDDIDTDMATMRRLSRAH
eukprot:gene3658-21634_t